MAQSWNEIANIKNRANQLERDKIFEIEQLIKKIVEEMQKMKSEMTHLKSFLTHMKKP